MGEEGRCGKGKAAVLFHFRNRKRLSNMKQET